MPAADTPSAGKPILIVGGGGHAKVVIEILRDLAAVAGTGGGVYRPVGILDPQAAGEVLGVPVLGGDDRLESLRAEGIDAVFVALGGNRLRERVGAKAVAAGYMLPSLVHPSAVVLRSAVLGQGIAVMPRAVVGAEAWIGDLAIVNTAAVVEHDNRLDTAAHAAPGSALAGNVSVGRRSLVGVGASVRPGVRIGDDVIVGAGSSVVSDLLAPGTFGGVPARPLKGKP